MGKKFGSVRKEGSLSQVGFSTYSKPHPADCNCPYHRGHKSGKAPKATKGMRRPRALRGLNLEDGYRFRKRAF